MAGALVNSRTCAPLPQHTVVVPRHRVSPVASPMTGSSGGSSTPRLIHFITGVSGILDHPLSRMMTVEVAAASLAPQRNAHPRNDRKELAPPTAVIPRESGGSSTPRLIRSSPASLEYWIIRFRG